jgi:hypothetical protein
VRKAGFHPEQSKALFEVCISDDHSLKAQGFFFVLMKTKVPIWKETPKSMNESTLLLEKDEKSIIKN